jgi:hypothetical protein
MDDAFWSDLAPYGLFKSDLVLSVHHLLTEPTCPTVTVRFEMPDRARTDIVASAHRDTVEDAIAAVLAEAKIKLPQIAAALRAADADGLGHGKPKD